MVTISDVIIVSEQESLINDILYCFQASGIEMAMEAVNSWDALNGRLSAAEFKVVIADGSSEGMPVKKVLESSRKVNPACLFYGVFESVEEDSIAELIHLGATSFALKDNLFRLAGMVQKAMNDNQYQVLIPEAIKREYFLSSFFEQATEAIWVKDKEGKYLLINPAGAQFISKPIEEIIGKYDDDIFPAATAAKIHQSDRYVILTGQTHIIEDSITNQDNVKRIFQAVKTVLKDRKGEVQGLIGTVRDITERKQAEQSVKEAEHRFNMLMQHVKDAAVYMLNPEQPGE